MMTIIGYSYSFYRRVQGKGTQPFNAAVLNNKVMILIMSILFASVIFIIMTWLYAAGILNPYPSQAGGIGLIVASYLPVLAVIVYILFFLQYLGVGVDEREISFIGERILLRNVEGIDILDAEKLLVLRYRYGFRNPKSKKMKFKLQSQTGQLLLANQKLITAEVDSEADEPVVAPVITKEPTPKQTAAKPKSTSKPKS